MRSVIKIISFTLVLSIIFAVLALPVSASAVGNYELALSIFDVLASGDSGQNTFLTQFLDEDFNSSSGCPNTSDGIHVWQYSNWIEAYPGVGNYRCMSCGLDYSDYCAGIYNKSLSENYGLTTYHSSGALIWQPTWDDVSYANIVFAWKNSGDRISSTFDGSESFYDFVGDSLSVHIANSNYLSFEILDSSVARYSGSGSFFWQGYYGFSSLKLIVPIDGTYSIQDTVVVSGYLIRSSDSGEFYPSYTIPSSSGSYISAGSTFLQNYITTSPSSVFPDSPYNYGLTCSYVDVYVTLPVFKIIPLQDPNSSTYNLYVNASRPTYNITYDLATVNNYGDYTVINNVYENQTIVNEGDNIYTDIETGNEYEIEGWEFDYTTRTYHLTLDNGDLVDVSFGDEYVTVEVNGEVEYYYYATEDDSAAGCTHEYDLAESVSATCEDDGYNVYVCTLCNHSYKDQTFAIGHNYQFLWTVLDTYEVDTSTLVCPGCNGSDITCTQVDNTENFTCVCNSADCAQTWTVVGSTIAGYDLYQCINCQEFYNDYTHEGVDRSDAGYWSWLQTWLQNFKTWLGEKLDALINKEVAVGGDTINNEEVNNFYDQSDTTINTDESIDYNITYTDGDGVEQETSLKTVIAKFAFIKDIWKIGQTLIAVVSEDAAYAYEFDPDIGNETTTDTGTETATVSVEEEADTLLSSSSGAPSIPLNLGAAESVYGWNYGGEVEMLELDWYTPYKETVDKLTGGFLWLFFMWKLFQRAPDIISGAGMDSYKQEDISAGNKLSRRRVKTNWRSRP